MGSEASECRNQNQNQRDMLHRFLSPAPEKYEVVVGDFEESEVVVGDFEESEDVELSLGLSLGGRFGVEKVSKKLIRSSSSVAGAVPPAMYRTASFPVETWRKRKELQSMRRMEAKRRRSEKQRGSRDGVAAGSVEIEGSAGFDLRENQHFSTSNRFGSLNRFGIPGWTATGRLGSGRSPEMGGGSSSGNSKPEGKPGRGSGSHDEARSLESSNEDSTRTISRTPKTKKLEIGIGATGDMPSVFTMGDGSEGRRVDGILYKYGKGEEVRIMCVCHGSFLSPADFVKHAGGGEVVNPLRRIVINPSASSSL